MCCVILAAADQSRLKVTIGGTSVIAQQMNEKVASDLMRAEMITFPILLGPAAVFLR